MYFPDKIVIERKKSFLFRVPAVSLTQQAFRYKLMWD